MVKIHKKMVTDETGKPTEVIIPIEEYQEIEELLGLDLDESDRQSIEEAQKARNKGQTAEFRNLNDLD